MTTNIKDYSTTQSSNTSLNGISVAEGMLPSNLNNAIRALMKNTRDWFNDAQWVEYGDGSGAYTAAYASGTSFTINGADVTSIYHAGRRIKLIATTPGTIFGTISSSSFSTNTTVNITWDSGSLSNETIDNVYIGILSKTNNSIPEGVIETATLADGSVTTAKIANDAVNNDKIADNAVQASQLNANAVTEAKINASAVTTTKIADDAITTAKITDSNVSSAKLADNAVTTAKINNSSVTADKLATNAVTTAKITDANVTTAKIADDNITTAKILDSNVTTAKIADDAVTAAKIADAVLVTASEQSGSTPDDVTVFTTSAANNRFFNVDSSETINSGQTWSDSDSFIATTAAISARVIDLVDDVGGFVPIANETSFPNTNPDVNDGVGTIVSVEALSQTYTANGSGVVTIPNGTVGNSTVTLNDCGANASLPSGFGILVESTTTQHTYNFHRLTPKATEVSTVASISSDITTVANNDSNITSVAGNATDISTVAGSISNVNSVGGSISNVNTVAGNTANINTVATNDANVTNVGGSIANVNTVAGSISNVNTTASNITGVNSFAERYRVASSAPSSSLDVGDLYFDTTANELKVYKSSGWAAAGSTVNGTSARFKYTASGSQTTFTGSDDNGNTLAYDAGFIDIYKNGAKLVNGTDVTVTSGTSVVLATGAVAGDIIDIVAYGTFDVAAISASNITSGTLNDARLPTTMAGKTLTTATVEANSLTARGDGSSADGKITLNCSQNSHGVKIQSPAHSAGQSYTLILPTSVGSANQVLASNGSSTNQLSWIDAAETKPTVANVAQTIAPDTATTISITGTNFVSIPQVEFIKTDGSVVVANTISFTNATTLSVNVTLALGNYYVRVENPDGNAGRSTNNIITSSTAPTFSTAAGSLGTIAGNFSGTVATIAGSSDTTIAFSETTSVLTNASQANCTLNSTTGVITTSDFGGSSTTPTTYNFTIRITDQENQTADRNFSLTSSFGATGGGQFN
ncbi:phage tail fiber protein [uncultured Mediterranean phage uvMED]|nr:phage tail fiber protein [uncultured Mediterranean phage uvMED]BAR18710.1 tail fiber [uncultured Mediterranean phage uvMED]BAR18777.1 tail fiber [uncultured Mediterranean phage uvMED]BAR18840.1 tail fiber [uncultured Mediterranean phage uvMED]BAR18857.1 tail fiber [uncultured Mediterranean phage uvMED]